MKPLILLSCIAAALSLATATHDEKTGKPYHELLIDKLRQSDDVLPPQSDDYVIRPLYNGEAVIPPQCYTKHDKNFNACYVCHQAAIEGRENAMNDDDLQAEYSFSDLGMSNHYKNLFEDRSERTSKISDEDILAYINEDNYSELPTRLQKANFKGWIPNLKNLQNGPAAFDENGFAKDGSLWVAFNYKPMPSTFWPTNGSTDDVMIRLGERFRQNSEGKESLDVYKANLAILEANIKGLREVTCLPLDENAVGTDLNGDGELGTIETITKVDAYVGGGNYHHREPTIFPEGTEFLHTVRYIGVNEKGEISVSKRMKEVRYMKKWRAFPRATYHREYQEEGYNKDAGLLPYYTDIGVHGLDNGNGWSVSGFIEAYNGRLRALTYEENQSCMGCHNSIGSTIDKTFSFARKIDGAKGWGYINLKGMPDAPNKGESVGEYATYLKRVGGGSEFRNNEEMTARWFQPYRPTEVDPQKLATAKDVYDLITPSRERALALNKAYKTIVEDQDYIYGKDGLLSRPANVFEHIDNKTSETLPEDKQYRWNILLDWSH